MSDLSVWWGDRVVGTLRKGDGGAIWFQYVGSATSRDHISLSLPVDALQERLGTFFFMKYEADGGPALADVIRLLSAESTSPAADVEKVIRWQAFNALVGNCDAHAKNPALLHEAGRVTLAPFYDLVCTRQWGSHSKRLAFSVGGVFDPGALGANQWARAARDWEIAPAFVLDLVRQTAAALKGALAQLSVLGAEAGLSRPSMETVTAIVRKGIRRSEQLLREGR